MTIEPLTSERWDDFVELFSRKGPRGGSRNAPAYGCWCMYWRDRGIEGADSRKRAMAALVHAGREPGLLAYDDGSAVGWISVAPREEFAAICRSPQYGPRDDDEGIWSIVCLLVDKPVRGTGVAAALLDAAVAYALAHGASAVEAYPHVADRHDYMGHTELYESAGFTKLRDANKRTIVRRPRSRS